MTEQQPTLFLTSRRGRRRGWLYFLRIGRLLKVGFTMRLIDQRLGEYRTHTGEPIELLAIIGADRSDEAAIHKAFAPWRIRSEWYQPPMPMFDILRKMRREDQQVTAA